MTQFPPWHFCPLGHAPHNCPQPSPPQVLPWQFRTQESTQWWAMHDCLGLQAVVQSPQCAGSVSVSTQTVFRRPFTGATLQRVRPWRQCFLLACRASSCSCRASRGRRPRRRRAGRRRGRRPAPRRGRGRRRVGWRRSWRTGRTADRPCESPMSLARARGGRSGSGRAAPPRTSAALVRGGSVCWLADAHSRRKIRTVNRQARLRCGMGASSPPSCDCSPQGGTRGTHRLSFAHI